MTTKTDVSALEMRKTLKAPVDRVFKAWTEPEQMIKWFGCWETSTVNIQQDFRVGGDYSHHIHCEDGKNVTMSGTFLEIVPNKKLVYTWTSTSEEYPAVDTVVTVEFNETGATTELVLKHSKFDRPISVQGHSVGWGAALDKFEALFA